MNIENQTFYFLPLEPTHLLDPEFFLYVYEQQSYLDAEFLKVANRQPRLIDRKNSLLDERGEFYNETKRESRYWTFKSNDRQRLLEEYSDMLHFYMGIVILQVEERLELLRGSGLLFQKQEKEMRDEMVLSHLKQVTKYYTETAELWIFKPVYDNQRNVELDDVIDVLSEGRRVYQPHQVIAVATLVISLFGITGDEIERQYKLVRDNNYERISRTKQGLPDR